MDERQKLVEAVINDNIRYKLSKLHWVSHWYMKDVVRILDEAVDEFAKLHERTTP